MLMCFPRRYITDINWLPRNILQSFHHFIFFLGDKICFILQPIVVASQITFVGGKVFKIFLLGW